MSRIYYEGKFYDYPLKAFNALRNLGVVEAVLCVLSYVWARIRPPKDQTNYEGWLVARFGWRLYRTFFKTYNEKVWGVPVADMPADWAAQRVKSLSLSKAIFNAVLPKRNQKEITSLIEEFEYPKLGPGQMWEVCRVKVEERGAKVLMETRVTTIHHEDGKAVAVTADQGGTPMRTSSRVPSSTRYSSGDDHSSSPSNTKYSRPRQVRPSFTMYGDHDPKFWMRPTLTSRAWT
jgi:protoporphyrinogen oxidase